MRLAVLAATLAVTAPLAEPAAAAAARGRGADDLRIELVELERQERPGAPLSVVERQLAADPELAWAVGLDFLAGHLLEAAGRNAEAYDAFIRTMAHTPELAGYGRYRVAAQQEALGHPEVAAGLVATVVAQRSPEPLIPQAVRLLRTALAQGGDCRLLGNLDPGRYDRPERRELELAAADCALRRGEPEPAIGAYLRLLDESLTDEPARFAAERVEMLSADVPPPRVARLLGLAFHQHRDFDRAIRYLGPLVASFAGELAGERYELAYALVRSRFWQEDFAAAAAGFSRLAARARDPKLIARALYQQARCHELLGETVTADRTYRLAYRADPIGPAADGALIGALRLEWRGGNESGAQELFEILAARREWIEVSGRAALFLAASDLAVGRSDRAGSWLDAAERGGKANDLEVAYWRGRLAELAGDRETAVRRYLRVRRLDLYHPVSLEAERRLVAPGLAPVARALGEQLAGGDLGDRTDAWLLLAAFPQARAVVAHGLARKLAASAATRPWVTLATVPTEQWPVWQAELDRPEEMLLALGLFDAGAPALSRHFPYSRPPLAFTASSMLARTGAVHRSLGVAETLRRQTPDAVPDPFLPPELRRLLYPFAWGELLVAQTLAQRVDPNLLAAIIREESRFDPRALSAASARGLTQFVQPTAELVAPLVGLDRVTPEDLYRPQVSIALGAAYLGRLLAAFAGQEHMAVAAYNAGPPAARLWARYTYTPDLAEYYTKVSYRETRDYLRKVLAAQAQYRELYGAPGR